MGKNAKNIVVLIDRYRPIIGGAQNNVHELSRRLVFKGFNVSVLTRIVFPGLKKEETLDSVKVNRFGAFPVRIISKLLCSIQIITYLIKHRREYDVVICVPCAYFTDLLPAYISYLVTKKPYVIRTTGVGNLDDLLSNSDSSIQGRIKSAITPGGFWRRVLDRAARIVVQTPVLLERASTYGLKDCLLIQSGADSERFRVSTVGEKVELRKQLDLPEDRIILVSTGRYIKEKNQISLIKAAMRVENNQPGKIMVLIIGATECNQINSAEVQIKDYVSGHGITHLVEFIDNVMNIEDYLRASDIFVFPSMYDEGMSNALIEAMLCGLAIIASDMPQVTRTFPDEEGLFFPAMNIEMLTMHIQKLIGSESYRSNLGVAIAAFAKQHYSSDRVANEYAALLYDI